MLINNTNLSQPVRVHGKLVHFPWARLWYFLRGISRGTGCCSIHISELLKLFETTRATLYRWLKQGKKIGAFGAYNVRLGKLTVYLGSKFKVTKNLNLVNWGGTIEVPIRQCLRKDFYIFGALIQTAELQRASWWAAKFSQDKNDKRRLLNISDFFKQGATATLTSLNMPELKLQPFKIRKLVFGRFVLTRRSFIPIGASQQSIGKSIGLCSRSIRNHQLGVKRNQLCYPISKSEYMAREYLAGEQWESSGCFESSNMYWRYGTNIYDLDLKLKSEKFQQMVYKFNLLTKNSAGGLDKHKDNLLVAKYSTPKLSFLNFLLTERRESRRCKTG